MMIVRASIAIIALFLSLLSAAVAVEAVSASASASVSSACECAGDIGIEGNSSSSLLVPPPQFFTDKGLPINYGTSCNKWNMNLDECQEGGIKFGDDFCTSDWCYVYVDATTNNNNCPDSKETMFFVNTTYEDLFQISLAACTTIIPTTTGSGSGSGSGTNPTNFTSTTDGEDSYVDYDKDGVAVAVIVDNNDEPATSFDGNDLLSSSSSSSGRSSSATYNSILMMIGSTTAAATAVVAEILFSTMNNF